MNVVWKLYLVSCFFTNMFKQHNLKNNLTMITSKMRGTKTATVLVMVGTGSKYENKKNSGISHFLEHMIFKGTIKRPTYLEISNELDSMGAEFNAFTGKEYTGYWVKTEKGKIKKALDIVSDMLLNSTLSQEEIDREKGVIIEELNMYEDNPMMHIEDVFEQCLYGDSPAGRDTIGSKETILSFSRKHFTDYFNSQYGPENTIICAAGNINEKSIKKVVESIFLKKQFLDRGKDFCEKEKVIEKQSKPQIKVNYKKTDQTHISLGVRAYPRGHKDEITLKVLSIILGGSMSSRLFINLRERQGLAYYVHTSTEFYTDSGYLTTGAGVPTNKIDQAIKTILVEYNKIKNVLVDEAELQKIKDMMTGRVLLQLESSDSVANWYGRQAILNSTIKRMKKGKFHKNPLTPEEYLMELKAITPAKIKKVASDIFTNNRLNLAVIGPYKTNDKFVRLLKF